MESPLLMPCLHGLRLSRPREARFGGRRQVGGVGGEDKALHHVGCRSPEPDMVQGWGWRIGVPALGHLGKEKPLGPGPDL